MRITIIYLSGIIYRFLILYMDVHDRVSGIH